MTNLNFLGALVVVPVPSQQLTPTLDFFLKELGFKVSTIFPADEPKVAVIFGHGIKLRLDENAPSDTMPVLQLHCDLSSFPSDAPKTLTAPNGMKIVFEDPEPKFEIKPIKIKEVVLSTKENAKQPEDLWVVGRAGMEYRDLIPGRLDGACIASLIRINEGGPVPDYPHFHNIRFQIIYCRKGWVKVVYEDQGDPFIMNPGDAVLQAPGIRHRVLESSPNLEVVEISAPAIHATHADHSMTLPTGKHLPDRVYGAGQRFCRHVASEAAWSKLQEGVSSQLTQVGKASNDTVHMRVLRFEGSNNEAFATSHAGEMLFYVVLEGTGSLRENVDGGVSHRLEKDDSIVLPPGKNYGIEAGGQELTLLEFFVPIPKV
ncbi:hypothetical protein HDU97_004490 [Phlyctochytrium planicorne]|nr:hypothetical protein HDU97_004490 [Phlyctochytrium planicorne]